MQAGKQGQSGFKKQTPRSGRQAKGKAALKRKRQGRSRMISSRQAKGEGAPLDGLCVLHTEGTRPGGGQTGAEGGHRVASAARTFLAEAYCTAAVTKTSLTFQLKTGVKSASRSKAKLPLSKRSRRRAVGPAVILWPRMITSTNSHRNTSRSSRR